MEFRKAAEADVNSIMNIIRQAQAYLKGQGVNQWQNNYPNADTVRNDIKNNYGYVLVKDHQIVGTVTVIFDIEKTYEFIYQGNWISNEKYAVIHRIAVDSEYKGLGLASVIVKHIEAMCMNRDVHSIRVDTHKDNISMQKMLQKNGFQYCGIIYLADKSERIAFEKLL
jgi:ribosomal protein S18 acetylase RimI-like enzyme